MTSRSRVTPRSREERLLLQAVPGGGVGMGRDRHTGGQLRRRGIVPHDAGYVRRDAVLASVITLSMPARTRVPARPTVMSLTKQIDERIGPIDRSPGTVELEVTRSHVRRVPPRRCDQVTGTRSATWETSSMSRPRPGTVRSTTDRTPRSWSSVNPRTASLDRFGRRPHSASGRLPLQLRIPDEDVLAG